ncbi:porin, partial [Vibrio parahaemolyticus]|nr:porin [Vibrio parahaemolyticus]
ITKDAISHIIAANYGEYGSGIYAAIVYGMNEYFYAGLEETVQLEGLLAYGFNNWTLSVNYEAVEDDKASKTLFSQSALQAEYAVTPSFYTYAGYQFDLGNDINKVEDDAWTIGARYYF